MKVEQNIEKSDTRQYILQKAVPLLASNGYSGVSMRDISKAVGVSSAALYHHFSDKECLYIEVMKYAFSDKALAMTEILSMKGSPFERLEYFIKNFVSLMEADPDFRALVQWELLAGDEARLKLVAEEVFFAPFQAITVLAEELDMDCDPHMAAVSIIGLVMFHFETAPILRFLPGAKPEHNDPKNIAQHVTKLLRKTFLTN